MSEYSPTEKQNGVVGLGNVLRTVGSLLLMCDPRDLGVALGSENSSGSKLFEPTLYLYDNYPGGIGQSEPLFRLRETLLAKSREWGIHLTQVATRCCGRAKASTKKRIPRLLLWRGVGLRSASDSRSCRPKAATAMNSRVGRLGGHSHDSRNLTFLFRSREATTH